METRLLDARAAEAGNAEQRSSLRRRHDYPGASEAREDQVKAWNGTFAPLNWGDRMR
jgi:hypothetical protein